MDRWHWKGLITDVSQQIQPAEPTHFPKLCSLGLGVSEAGNKNDAVGESWRQKSRYSDHPETVWEVCGGGSQGLSGSSVTWPPK